MTGVFRNRILLITGDRYQRIRDRRMKKLSRPRVTHIRTLCAISLVVTGLMCRVGAQTASPRVGQGFDLSGKFVDPLRASANKIVVLVFVRTDCPISNRYAPTIQRMSGQFAGKVAFWLVYPDKMASADVIGKHLKEYGYVLPVMRDPQHAWVRRSGALVTPEAAVFDTTGKLVYHGRIDNLYEAFGRSRNAATTHELADSIAATLRGETPKTAETEAVGCYIADLE